MKKAFTGFLSCFFALSVIFTSLVFVPVSAERSGGVKFGVMSDLHFHDGTTGIDSNIYTMLNYYKEQNVDAILVLGDVANSAKETQFAKFTTAWDSVFTDAESAPKRLVIMGNHEFENAYYKRETVADAQQRYMTAYGYDTLNFNVKVNGYHFIGINSESAAIDGRYTETTVSWLKAQLDAAAAEDPDAPIFVGCHQPIFETTYGSGHGAGNTKLLKELLKNYPQVVYFSGHSHRPCENERCIWQGEFTCIDCTSMQYVSLEPDVNPSDAYQAQGSLLVNVDESAGKITVNRKRINNGVSPKTVKDAKAPWVLSLPLSTESFVYTDARINDRTAPVFPENAGITVSNVSADSAGIAFPSAAHSDYVHSYNVTLTNNKTGNCDFSETYITDYYIDINNMKPQQSFTVSGLSVNTEYTVSVKAAESFGLESEPLTASFTTEAFDEVFSGYTETYSYTTSNGEHPTLFNETEGVTFSSDNMEKTYDIFGEKYIFAAQRTDGSKTGVLRYDFADKYITKFNAALYLMDAFVQNYSCDYLIKLEALTDGSDLFTEVPLTINSRETVIGKEGYSRALVSNVSAFPDKTTALRISLAPHAADNFAAGGVGYTLRLDEISAELVSAKVKIDELDTLEKTSESSNVKTRSETFGANTYHGVTKDANEAAGVIRYAAQSGKEITSVYMEMLIMDAFFKDIKDSVSLTAVSGDTLTPLAFDFTKCNIVNDNGAYSVYRYKLLCNNLPFNTDAVIITLDPNGKNYTNYTAIIDKVYVFNDVYTTGDANGDGVLNILDFVYLKKTVAEAADKKIPACDFNHDGKLDGNDLINMRKKLLKTA